MYTSIYLFHITFIHVPLILFAKCVYVIILYMLVYWAYSLYFQNKLYNYYLTAFTESQNGAKLV